MNSISKNRRIVTFDVSPIFSVYEESLQYWKNPTPETLLSHYDMRVRDRVRELEVTYPLTERGYPWGEASGINEDELELITDYLKIRPILLGYELIEVLDTYHMFYLHDGEFHNMPFVGVW